MSVKSKEFIPIGKYKIYFVNGSVLRNFKGFADFLDFGIEPKFKIPKNEIWIEETLDEEEKSISIVVALDILKNLESGKSLDLSYTESKRVAQRMRSRIAGSKTKKKNILDGVHRELLFDGPLKIWLVNGKRVRTRDPYFIQGGHGYVYDYIPKEEVWIDDTLPPNEYGHVILHEVAEVHFMKDQGLSYDKAHLKATNLEYNNQKKLV